MNRVEFREEIMQRLGQKTVDLYDEFCFYQDEIWNVLLWFAKFCEKGEISYQLAYGSLLGLVRDSGQIPWDYDIDVLVPYREREKLITLLEKELPSDYYYISTEVDKKYHDTILRIVPKGFHEAYFHLDVFFFIGTATDEIESKSHRDTINTRFWERYYKLFDPYVYAHGRIKSTIRLWLIKLRAQLNNVREIEKELSNMAERYPVDNCEYVTTLDQWAPIIRFPVDIMNTVLFTSENGTFRVPICYEEILKNRYGDFTQIPQFENRVKEFTRHLMLIKKYAKIK